MWTADQIAAATGDDAAHIAAIWPQVVAALEQIGIDDHPTRIAAAATAAVEMDFAYLAELGSGNEYEGRADLGNTQPGDGARYRGRGVVQITGRANYTTYGQRLGIDLIGSPDLACDPRVAGLVLALYFKDHGIPAMAAAGDWYGVRRAINGGYNGIARFLACVRSLAALPDTPPTPAVTCVSIAGALKTQPNHTSLPAIDAQRKPAHLRVGQIVHFCGDPHMAGHPTVGGDGNAWAHISVDKSPVHGWYLRASLATTGGT